MLSLSYRLKRIYRHFYNIIQNIYFNVAYDINHKESKASINTDGNKY